MRRLFQFETRKQPVASQNVFVSRLTRNAISSAAIASMGPLNPLLTDGGKIFAALYAIFSGFLLIGISTLMLAPIFHRILHRFHVDEHDADPPQRRH